VSRWDLFLLGEFSQFIGNFLIRATSAISRARDRDLTEMDYMDDGDEIKKPAQVSGLV
jgi:hypothetical protein